MKPDQALLLGLAIVLVLLVIAAYVWYHFIGWKKFAFRGTVPYALGPRCNANAPPGSACPRGKTCCPAGTVCAGAACVRLCRGSADCGGAPCAGGVCQAGTRPSWSAASSGRPVSALRFRNCVFTVVDPRGATHSADVTAVLNGMAAAFRGAARPLATLYLDRPLNAFSFVIKGVNDSATVLTAAEARAWAGSATSLSGEWRVI